MPLFDEHDHDPAPAPRQRRRRGSEEPVVDEEFWGRDGSWGERRSRRSRRAPRAGDPADAGASPSDPGGGRAGSGRGGRGGYDMGDYGAGPRRDVPDAARRPRRAGGAAGTSPPLDGPQAPPGRRAA